MISTVLLFPSATQNSFNAADIRDAFFEFLSSFLKDYRKFVVNPSLAQEKAFFNKKTTERAVSE